MRGLGLWKLPNIWGSPLIFLQRSRCPLSVSAVSCFFIRRDADSKLVLGGLSVLLMSVESTA